MRLGDGDYQRVRLAPGMSEAGVKEAVALAVALEVGASFGLRDAEGFSGFHAGLVGDWEVVLGASRAPSSPPSATGLLALGLVLRRLVSYPRRPRRSLSQLARPRARGHLLARQTRARPVRRRSVKPPAPRGGWRVVARRLPIFSSPLSFQCQYLSRNSSRPSSSLFPRSAERLDFAGLLRRTVSHPSAAVMARAKSRFGQLVTIAILEQSATDAQRAYDEADALPATSTIAEFETEGFRVNGPLFTFSDLTVCYRGTEAFVVKLLGARTTSAWLASRQL